MTISTAPDSPSTTTDTSNTETKRENKALSCTPAVLWFTGLSGAGKTTIATALQARLQTQGIPAFHLDGNRFRAGLSQDLGLSEQDHSENLRRAGELCRLLTEAGMLVLATFTSSKRVDRTMLRKQLSNEPFIECFVDAPLELCEARQTEKAELSSQKSSVNQVYEPPSAAELVLNTSRTPAHKNVEHVIDYLTCHGILQFGRR
jgi:adenylylsulfate kinase